MFVFFVEFDSDIDNSRDASDDENENLTKTEVRKIRKKKFLNKIIFF